MIISRVRSLKVTGAALINIFGWLLGLPEVSTIILNYTDFCERQTREMKEIYFNPR